MGRSPHASVKVLPSTPTGQSFPSGIRVSRRPPPSGLGTLPTFGNEAKSAFGSGLPGSPGLPVFARRKRSVFKGPGMTSGGSPSGFGRTGLGSRSNSIPRKSGEQMIPGITEEEEEEEEEMEDDDGDEGMEEEVDQFGPELSAHVANLPGEAHAVVVADGESTVGEMSTAPVSPLGPLTPPEKEGDRDPLAAANGGGGGSVGGVLGNGSLGAEETKRSESGSIPLTAEALAKNQRVVEEKEKEKERERERTGSRDGV